MIGFGTKEIIEAKNASQESPFDKYLDMFNKIERQLREIKAEMGGAYTLFVVGIAVFVGWSVFLVKASDDAAKLGPTGEAIPLILAALFVLCGAILFLIEDWIKLKRRQLYLGHELAQQTELIKLVGENWSRNKKDPFEITQVGQLVKELRSGLAPD